MSTAPDREREQGFSLVEVLCALAIAAAAVSALMAGIAGSLRGAGALEDRLAARIILRSILEDELASAATVPAHREGESGPYRWRLDIAPAAPVGGVRPPPPSRLYRLEAGVSWGKGGMLSESVLKLAR